MADGGYEAKVSLGVMGAQVVLLATDGDGRDPKILLEMNPVAARRIGLELIAGAAQVEEGGEHEDLETEQGGGG